MNLYEPQRRMRMNRIPKEIALKEKFDAIKFQRTAHEELSEKYNPDREAFFAKSKKNRAIYHRDGNQETSIGCPGTDFGPQQQA